MRANALVLLLCAICGCATVTYQAAGDKPVLLGGVPEKDYRVVRHTTDEGRTLWLFWLLLPIGQGRERVLTDLANAGGDGVTNVTIHEHYGIIDFVIQNITRGLIATVSEDYEADIIQYNK
jgi:hypothetical protein